MNFEKIIYHEAKRGYNQEGPPFIISYLNTGGHALVAVSQKVGDSYYVLYSLGLWLTGKAPKCYNGVTQFFMNHNAELLFDYISRSKVRPEVRAIHYASSSTRALKLFYKMIDIVEEKRVTKNFNILKLNCHNFASFLMFISGIIDNQFLGGTVPLKGEKYILKRVRELNIPYGQEKRNFFMLRDRFRQNYCYLEKEKQSSLRCCSSSNSDNELKRPLAYIFKWPSDIKISYSCTYSPDKSLFRVAESHSELARNSEDLRLNKAKSVIMSYVKTGFFQRRNYNKEVSDLFSHKPVLGLRRGAFDTVDEVLKKIITTIYRKEFHPNMGGDLIKRLAFVKFFLDKNYHGINERLDEREVQAMRDLDTRIENNIKHHGTRYKQINDLLHKAYIIDYDYNAKYDAFKKFRRLMH
ncbi:MAG: hypothetical protein GY750_20490 [Lentisphaerae bacterium]|nr:hypothetical protein [Lentisphaerota bacterium]MCP4103772.1 hypothetical protein [Lentisphaerota bacterium]